MESRKGEGETVAFRSRDEIADPFEGAEAGEQLAETARQQL